MTQKQFSFSICIPVYKGASLLKMALDSIYKQQFNNYEIIIGDDNPPELVEEIKKTQDLVKSYNDPRITYIKNEKNLGYPLNLRNIVSKAKNDILFLMAQDDILSMTSLQKTHDAFLLDDDIGVVTRPFFMFIGDPNKPVRAIQPYSVTENTILTVKDNEKLFLLTMFSVSQLSGLAYRREFIDVPFHEEVFPAHIYPFASVFKRHKCVFLKDYTVAARIESSQTRSVPSIYKISPTESWIKMYKTIFGEKGYETQLEWGIKDRTTNFVGLVQIRNYAGLGAFLKELYVMFKYRKQIALTPAFWLFFFGLTFTPAFILKYLSDLYKTNVLAKTLPQIEFAI